MRKTPVRVVAVTASLAGALLLPAVTASAASPYTKSLDTTAENGGDRGWGNCGYNSSGGREVNALGGPNRGNGGFKPGDTCVRATPPQTPQEDIIEVDPEQWI